MDYRSLGTTGMQVSPLCLGAMMFGVFGEPDHDKSVAIIHRALDQGVNFIDTADIYSQGESEEIVGKALAGGRRDDVILATKFHGAMDVPFGSGETGDPNRKGNTRRWVIKEVEDSLRRLQTDWIDLYQVHRWDHWVSHEETLSALTDLRTQGKIRAFGSSTFPAHESVEAQWVAERRGLGHYSTEQPPYSILTRGIEADILPVAQKFGMGVIPWSPLAGGWLTGRKRDEGEQTPRQRMMSSRFDMSLPVNQAKAEAVDALEKVAEEAGLSMIHLALGFVLAHPAVTAPIIGPRTMEHLESQLGAADVVLGKDVLDKIDEIAPPGEDVAAGERSFTPPAVAEAALRRRPSGMA